MNRLEFEKAVGHVVNEDDYLMAELILANTRAIQSRWHTSTTCGDWRR